MKKLRWLAAGAGAVVLVSGVVTGCGGTGNNSSAAKTANPSSNDVPKGQTITLWVWKGGPEFNDVKQIAQAWAKKHGDTIKVVDQSKNPNGFQFYATAARTGKGPDVLFGMPHDNNGLFVQEGLVAQVPDGVLNTNDYNESVLNALKVNGQYYSLPISVETSALFYNKKLVKTPPSDWQSFVKTANKVGFMYDQANLYFDYALIGGMGGYVFKNDDGSLNPNDIGLANSGSVQAFALMHDMDTKYHWMTPSTNGAVAKAKFTAGKLGMYISGPWDIPDIKKANIDFGVVLWPTLPNGHAATPFMGVQTVIVNAKSKTQAADWSLAEELTSSAAETKYFNDAQQIPARKSLQQSETVQSDPYFKVFAEQTKTAVPMPNIPQMQAVWNAMSVITNIINGKVSPEQGAKDLVKNIQKGIRVQGS
ncbi:maltose ABC transporter substrate-binding protein [Alicyclobacillus herbarius]|uniref:sugar ABC transporter substrate-binding protein n=1 Tax=Alicyclobacillus herbarius TaxID=122960 RepID=UPI002356A9D8|nr:maltose ABC transporter substrate-binding protein [Alicyclobacillus herbarius]